MATCDITIVTSIKVIAICESDRFRGGKKHVFPLEKEQFVVLEGLLKRCVYLTAAEVSIAS